VFDALTHARPYKRAWSVNDSLSEIHRLRDQQFDPSVIDAFMELDPHSLVELAPSASAGAGVAAGA
jgi:putative two-component system response regulator